MQGTLYPDVVESGGGTGTANIKSHHNVGGLPDDLQFAAGRAAAHAVQGRGAPRSARSSACPPAIVWRQPFPGPGLGIRIIGEVTARAARRAARGRRDRPRGADRAPASTATIWQCPVVLLADVRSVGVQGDGRTYGHPVVLRPVSTEDAMTADWSRLPYDVLARISTRITNEVREVNRVVLDVTSKPPGTIEWEWMHTDALSPGIRTLDRPRIGFHGACCRPRTCLAHAPDRPQVGEGRLAERRPQDSVARGRAAGAPPSANRPLHHLDVVVAPLLHPLVHVDEELHTAVASVSSS